MTTEKADAIVIRQADFSESSRVVTFFSKEFGKFAALAKGAKRLKGPFDAALDLLSRCRIVFIRKSSGGLDLLTQASLELRFTPPSTSLNALYGGYYVADLLCSLTADYDPEPNIYQLTVQTLESLTRSDQDAQRVILNFELKLLCLMGILPNLSECCVCGMQVEPDSSVAHWVSQGGILCAGCRKQEYAGRSVSAASIATIRELTENESTSLMSKELTNKQLSECHQLAVSAITSVLGRKPQTLRYITL